jgi:hypothetical protein
MWSEWEVKEKWIVKKSERDETHSARLHWLMHVCIIFFSFIFQCLCLCWLFIFFSFIYKFTCWLYIFLFFNVCICLSLLVFIFIVYSFYCMVAVTTSIQQNSWDPDNRYTLSFYLTYVYLSVCLSFSFFITSLPLYSILWLFVFLTVSVKKEEIRQFSKFPLYLIYCILATVSKLSGLSQLIRIIISKLEINFSDFTLEIMIYWFPLEKLPFRLKIGYNRVSSKKDERFRVPL